MHPTETEKAQHTAKFADRVADATQIIERLIAPRVGGDKRVQLASARQTARRFMSQVCKECGDIPGNGGGPWGYCSSCRGEPHWRGERNACASIPDPASAVPALVKALEKLLPLAESGRVHHGKFEDTQPIMDQARAALALAQGGKR